MMVFFHNCFDEFLEQAREFLGGVEICRIWSNGHSATIEGPIPPALMTFARLRGMRVEPSVEKTGNIHIHGDKPFPFEPLGAIYGTSAIRHDALYRVATA